MRSCHHGFSNVWGLPWLISVNVQVHGGAGSNLQWKQSIWAGYKERGACPFTEQEMPERPIGMTKVHSLIQMDSFDPGRASGSPHFSAWWSSNK